MKQATREAQLEVEEYKREREAWLRSELPEVASQEAEERARAAVTDTEIEALRCVPLSPVAHGVEGPLADCVTVNVNVSWTGRLILFAISSPLHTATPCPSTSNRVQTRVRRQQGRCDRAGDAGGAKH